ncbi:unnamed protein product, partial [Mesorhabditis spiculigera]
MAPTAGFRSQRTIEMIKRGKRFVRRHVGTDTLMSVMNLRRSMGQTLRHLVELNHRSEMHFMLVAYDPRPDNPSLTFYGSKDLVRAGLKSNLKDEICHENPPKTHLKNTLRVPVFSPRDSSELEELAEKESEESSLTQYFYKEMQRCTFPMLFFKPKASETWLPREKLAFWPPDLKISTLHDPEFGQRTDEQRFASKVDCIMYILEYIRAYYYNVVLRSMQLHLQNTEDGFIFTNQDDFTDEQVEVASEIVNRELCTRLFVSWVLNPLRNTLDEKVAPEEQIQGAADESDEIYTEDERIDVCGEETVSTDPEPHPRPSTSQETQHTTVNTVTTSPGTKTIMFGDRRVTLRRLAKPTFVRASASECIPQRAAPVARVPPQPIRYIRVPSSRVFGGEPPLKQMSLSVGPGTSRQQSLVHPPEVQYVVNEETISTTGTYTNMQAPPEFCYVTETIPDFHPTQQLSHWKDGPPNNG